MAVCAGTSQIGRVFKRSGMEKRHVLCKELLQGLAYECVQGDTDREITQVVYDSRKITEGCMFLCICGYNVDGHSFAMEAAQKGAAAIVVQRKWSFRKTAA